MGKKNWNRSNKNNRNDKKRPNQKFKPKYDPKSKGQQFKSRSDNVKTSDYPKGATSHSYATADCLQEKDINVTEYVGQTAGFKGIIKARFSDFQVNEIDIDGNVVKLTDVDAPNQPICESDKESEPEVRQLITEENWNKIIALAESTSKDPESVEINADNFTKEQRSLIHNTIKGIHGSTLIGSTIDKGLNKFIKFAKSNKSNQRDQRIKWLWPHEYTYFIMFKTNIDTNKAVTDLAKYLDIDASRVSYAGTKDKRGKTSQWCCLRKFQPDRVVKAAKSLSNVFVGNFTFKPEPLKLGNLKGNRFRIALREVSADKQTIENAMISLRDNGFINYYGLQRFGNNASVPTSEVGLALLQGQFKEACELILKPRKGEPPFMTAVREEWWKYRDPSAALKMFNKVNKSIEAKLLVGLSKHGPNDYVNALENIPRNMRLMYIHAYQSLIWNEMVTRRIKELGIKVCEGDLVFINKNAEELLKENETMATNDDGNMIDGEENQNDENIIEDDQKELSPYKAMVKSLSEGEANSGAYTIFDIVLPLPGHDITYPSNECGKWYEERLAKDNLSSEKLKLKQKTYSLCGAYRKVFIKPMDLAWHTLKYNDLTDNLILSDMDELMKENHPINTEDGKYEALIVEFNLPSSSYATMALREILKEDTSKSSQSQLTTLEKVASDSNTTNETETVDDVNQLKNIAEKRKAECDDLNVKKSKII